MRFKLLLVMAAFLTVSITNRDAAASFQNQISYNRDIRPIFADTCFRCHGPDKGSRKAGLRLDNRADAIIRTRSGIVPIVPGKPEESEIIRRIFSTDPNEMMPPRDSHKSLTTAQKESIRRWVAEGAVYEGHWAYQQVLRPVVPAVEGQLVRNPIDAFIQKRLKQDGLAPANEADKRTLMRRVSLDLTGLPPSPEELKTFLRDQSPDAYEKLVDRLMAGTRFAEKQAIHWLDAVRYADTSGFHGDNAFPSWPYRDYVLNAFRNNKPFDEFTREQIAGDLLPSATREQRIASAYNRLNRTSAEGGLQPKEYLAKYGADRVRTTSLVWLGSTMGCAECHDHKFDPFLSKDFYSLKAFFADIKETGLVPDRGRDAWGSKLLLATEEQKALLDNFNRQIAWTKTELNEKAKALSARRADWEKELLQNWEAGRMAWRFVHPYSAKSANGAALRIYNNEKLTVTQYLRGNMVTEDIVGDGLVVAGGAVPETDVYTVEFKPGKGSWTALGLEVVQDESLPADRFGRGGDRFVVSEFEAEVLDPGKPGKRLEYSLATTDGFGQPVEHPALAAVDEDLKTGWGVQYGDNRNAFLNLRLKTPLETSPETVVQVRIHQVSKYRKATIGRFRIALSEARYSWGDYSGRIGAKWLTGLTPDVVDALRVSDPAKRSTSQKSAVDDYFKFVQPELLELNSKLGLLEAQRDLLDASIPRSLVTETATVPQETRILPRGNFLDESGEKVEPAIPTVFGKIESNGQRATRLDLANWIVSRDNPLTARVFVNRLWRQFFGVGISRTLEDLGSQGEWPTHPELLDWLASEFMHPEYQSGKAEVHDWDIKHVVRLIVTSHTYRQSSMSDPASGEKDPDNRLLAHQSRYRVDSEIVRDIALQASGLLVEKFGGPSAKPYQPEGYLLSLNFPKRDYSADHGEALYRRAIYTHWQRTFLHPSLMAFDAPSREECTVNRSISNTPIQALVLLNDPIFVEASKALAERTLDLKAQLVPQKISASFENVTGRPINVEELKVLTELYRSGLKKFSADPRAAAELLSIGDSRVSPASLKKYGASSLAAMTMVARAILNLHETITRN